MRSTMVLVAAAALALACGCRTVRPASELQARCSREIVQLHEFFEDWFAGKLPDTDPVFARFADVLHPEFHIIGTSGSVLDRAAILELVRRSHGRSTGGEGAMVIEVRDVQWRSAVAGGYVLTYEEWQGHGAVESGRTSTVLFRPDPAGPNGLQWVHVHETALGPK